MTSIESPLPSIERLRVHPVPARPLKVAKAVRVGRHVVFLDILGRIYDSALRDGSHYTLASIHISEPFLKALAKLGVISGDDIRAHHEAAKRARENDEIRDSARELKKCLGHLGIKLTASQKARARKRISTATATEAQALAIATEAGIA